jgi:Zn-dependent protease
VTVSINWDPVGVAIWFVAFLLSATCHEAAHALAARLGGDDTAHEAGQVTLNPLPHLSREPFGMVFVPLLSYLWAGWMIGWASAPYDPEWAERHPRRAGWMALAGPAANFALAGVAVVGIRAMLMFGLGAPPQTAGFEHLVEPVAGADPMLTQLARFLSVMALLNGLLGTFNLMPLPPLDGAAVLKAFGGSGARRLVDAMLGLPMAGLVCLLIAWQLFGFLAPWVFDGVLQLTYPGVSYAPSA